MNRRRQIAVVVTLAAALVAATMSYLLGYRYVRVDYLVSAHFISNQDKAFLTVHTEQAIYRLTRLEILASAVLSAPLSSRQSCHRTVVHVCEVQNEQAEVITLTDRGVSSLLFPLGGETYLLGWRSSFDRRYRRGIVEAERVYLWNGGDLRELPSAEAAAVLKQFKRPNVRHYEATGWMYVSSAELVYPRDNRRIVEFGTNQNRWELRAVASYDDHDAARARQIRFEFWHNGREVMRQTFAKQREMTDLAEQDWIEFCGAQ